MEKTLITVVRHGETEWNVAMRLQGIKNSNLTAKGIKQVELAAEALSKKEFDVVISSDLGRALNTAEIITSKNNLKIIKDKSLRERNFGIMEGLTREEILEKHPDVYSAYLKRKDTYKIVNGESLIEFNSRVLDGLAKIVNLYEGKRILIISHGGVLDCIIRMVFSYSLSDFRNFSTYNTAINIFSILNKKWTLEEWGNVSHLNAMELLNDSN